MTGDERDTFYNALVERVNNREWTWGQAIRRLRVDVANMNQATFSRITRVSVRTIRQLEQDEANPTMETLQAMLTPFGLELAVQRKRST